MSKENAIRLFEGKRVRAAWDESAEKWFFSIADVVAVLTGSVDSGAYWRKLKERLLKEGNETVTNCHSLKMLAADGKMRLTDVADTEQLFRLIQSVPSPKAEPFKLWLAKVGRERIDEIEDPEIGIDRLMETYLRKGYTKEWINQRLKSIEVRKELADEWDQRGVKKGQEYAILTDDITRAWAGLDTREYKKLKDLKKENLRDHMSNLELVLNMLAEATTTEISKEREPNGFEQSRVIAKQGGTVAGNARREIEEKTGRKIVTSANHKKKISTTERKKLK
jgi:hypothetical protein